MHFQRGNGLSDTVNITEGTAQGPIGVAPLFYPTTYCVCYQFTDDTCLIAADKNLQSALSSLQSGFECLTKLCHISGIVMNPNKTKLLHTQSRTCAQFP